MEELTKHRNATEKELEKQLNKIGKKKKTNVPVSKTEDDNRVVRKWGEPSDLKINGEELGKLHRVDRGKDLFRVADVGECALVELGTPGII